MQLIHIALDRLSVSPANMRDGRKPPDIGDLLPSCHHTIPSTGEIGNADRAILAGRCRSCQSSITPVRRRVATRRRRR